MSHFKEGKGEDTVFKMNLSEEDKKIEISNLCLPVESKERGSSTNRHSSEERDEGVTDLGNRNTDCKSAQRKRAESPTPTCVSVKSDASIVHGITFSQHHTDSESKKMASGLTEDLLQCDMCKENFKDLVSIPSGHRYCRQCICMWDLSELVQVQQAEFSHVNPDHCYTGPGDVACDFCTGMKLRAVKSCLTCPASLCENHVRLHYTIPALQRHTLVEVTGDLEQRLCQQHHRALEVFCKTDQKHLCKVCAVEGHKNHSKFYTEISNVPDTSSFLKLTAENMKKEFKIFKCRLDEDFPDCLGSERLEDLNISKVVEKMLESFGEEGALRITFNFLDMGVSLRTVTDVIKANLLKKFQHISEGISQQGHLIFLNEIYTELYFTEGGSREVNNEHEVRQIEMTSSRQTTQDTPIKYNDIFDTVPSQGKRIRTVLTKGIAGIGKTVSVQKFILDWAEGKANQDIMVIVPLPFRDLNLKKENYSLIQLLHHYAPELKEIKNLKDEKLKFLFVFDGLDECRLPLDFQNNELCCDVTKITSVDVLLTNLIKGNLLPSALLWITSRPAAANQIPSQYIHQVTEIRGFRDPQKEEYFRKRISDQSLANRIITHIKSSRSLHIMCHIPVFCWLSAAVLENMMSDAGNSEIPKTLTEMYTHFLLIQISLKNKKYHSATVVNPKKLSQSDKEMILKLGKLAFQQLEKGNLIFYEEDLRECGIDVSKASEYSSVCTEIFREELGLYRERVFCFLHLSIQEHLAAVYAHVTCVNENRNVFNTEEHGYIYGSLLSDLNQSAVDKALQSKNGHLDLFLRFLLGLSVDTGQTLLQDLMTRSYSEMREHSTSKTIKYVKVKIREESSSQRIINLFHCLNELSDNSLVEEIQTSFRSGIFSEKELRPDQCSALAYMLLISEEVLDEFDLKMYKTSAVGQQRLLPVVRSCRKARLSGSNLLSESCVTVAAALKSVNSPLRELDLSYNNLTDSGVKILCTALMSQNCKLQIFGLAGCNLSSESCETMASTLQSVNSSLRELDLSYNSLRDSGVKLLCAALLSPKCKLQKLGLKKCHLTETCCVDLASVLRSPHSNLRELELRENDLQDSGVKLLSAGLKDQHCKLNTVGLASCELSSESCVIVASALKSVNSPLRDLDLSYNNLTDSEVKLLISSNRKLQRLRLAGCNLSSESCVTVASALKSVNSPLRELDLSYNNLTDLGVKQLCAGMMNPNCKLYKLRLACCNLTSEACRSVASVLQSENSPLRELDLSYNNLTGLKLLFVGLMSPHCKLQKLRLNACSLPQACCEDLASVLRSPHSKLSGLQLRDNELEDSGVKLLSAGLEDPNCKLEKLGLSGCLITEESCASLASALRSNPSKLREVDLSYNHLGDRGVNLLSALLEDPHCKLEKLDLGHSGGCRMKHGLRKYACQLTLDQNTAHRLLSLSEENKRVTGTLEEQPYPDHPERFKVCVQVLCKEALTERCYFEVEWTGPIVFIGVTYKSTGRDEGYIGMDNKSFSVFCESDRFSFWHNNKITAEVSSSHHSSRVGVYLDWAAGDLSFYSISNDTLTHLYTFHTTFTAPLYAGFVVYGKYTLTLCQLL